ncbi:LGFP repeat-containing protein, partial [Kineococcus vitellinus]|uniref:LGFP repeat-containing protein n=1 Tax=Kineococcus vitellinus TaxID=2696565 RepID=UPI003B83049E
MRTARGGVVDRAALEVGEPAAEGTGVPGHREAGAHEVRGAIREKWASMGWEGGGMGFPTTDDT